MSSETQPLPSVRISRFLDIRSACKASNPLRAGVVLAHSHEAAGSRATQSAVCRELLGVLLHKTIGIEAGNWRLTHAESGAPKLRVNHQADPINLSLSHSGGYLMAAISRNARIGVDVECHKQRKRTSELASFLGWIPDASDQMDFTARWTLWEAGAKCFEYSSLNSNNPAFNALDGKLQRGQPGTYGPWHGFMDRLQGQVHYSVVLHASSTACLDVQTSDLLQLDPWKNPVAAELQAGATIP